MNSIKIIISNIINKVRVYRKFGFLLLNGTFISNVNNISIGKKFKIGRNSFILAQGKAGDAQIVIGNNVGLNHCVMINADFGGMIRIGDNISIGPYTIIRASNHNFANVNLPIKEQGHIPGTIVLENDIWLGAHVVILPNVRIGHSSVIGAGSIVTKDIPPFSVAVGNPAEIIRTRNSDEDI